MSAYQMFVELIHKLTLMKPAQILTRLRIPETEDCIDEVARICISFDWPSHKQGSIPSRFWRYARMVDPGYFLKLQSKSNVLAVAILSELCYKYCSTDHRNMVVLANQDQIKKEAAKFVDDFEFDYDMLQLKSPKGGPIWKMVIQAKIAARKRQRTAASTDTVDEAMDAQTEQVLLAPRREGLS
ncbi:nucleoprotein [Camellia lanceoleosa]|uniref:Nucleoprotein n=1 Tax=Camellia lanceoleosa TaxID=1840588 RepID=A0ACC0I9R0_9ERIC|nr:nucleoprotein [Camellia lanceoleosa]